MMHRCIRCGELRNEGEVEIRHGEAVCRYCRVHYRVCIRCGKWVRVSDVRRVYSDRRINCSTCFEQIHGGPIPNPYTTPHYRVNLEFRGNPPYKYLMMDSEDLNSTRFFGVELEIDEGHMPSVVPSLRRNPFIWLKSDGSLTDRGVEVVSHPASFEFHKRKLGWDYILQTCRDCRYVNASRAGLHIHVNKESLGREGSTRELNLTKLAVIFDNVWKEMEVFSRRRNGFGYAGRFSSLGEKSDKRIENGAIWNHLQSTRSKFTCINIFHGNTAEFRIFGGTVNDDEFFGALELTNLFCDLAVKSSALEASNMRWRDIMNAAEDAKYNNMLDCCSKLGGILCPA